MEYQIDDDSASFTMYDDIELCRTWNAPVTENETKRDVVAESGVLSGSVAMEFTKETAPEPILSEGRFHCPFAGCALANGRDCNNNEGKGWKEHAGCKRHILGHGADKQYVCGLPLKNGTICNFSSNHSATMFAHRNGGKHVPYANYKYTCAVCGKKFPLRQGLDRHARKHQPSSKKRVAGPSKKARRGRSAKRHQVQFDMTSLLLDIEIPAESSCRPCCSESPSSQAASSCSYFQEMHNPVHGGPPQEAVPASGLDDKSSDLPQLAITCPGRETASASSRSGDMEMPMRFIDNDNTPTSRHHLPGQGRSRFMSGASPLRDKKENYGERDFDAFLLSMLTVPETMTNSENPVPLHDELLEQLARELESTIGADEPQSSIAGNGMEFLEDAGSSPLDQKPEVLELLEASRLLNICSPTLSQQQRYCKGVGTCIS